MDTRYILSLPNKKCCLIYQRAWQTREQWPKMLSIVRTGGSLFVMDDVKCLFRSLCTRRWVIATAYGEELLTWQKAMPIRTCMIYQTVIHQAWITKNTSSRNMFNADQKRFFRKKMMSLFQTVRLPDLTRPFWSWVDYQQVFIVTRAHQHSHASLLNWILVAAESNTVSQCRKLP